MDWIVSKTKADFMGKRVVRPRRTRRGRTASTSSGLLPVDPGALLAEGAQLVADAGRRPRDARPRDLELP